MSDEDVDRAAPRTLTASELNCQRPELANGFAGTKLANGETCGNPEGNQIGSIRFRSSLVAGAAA
jgi:hypothetical protein